MIPNDIRKMEDFDTYYDRSLKMEHLKDVKSEVQTKRFCRGLAKLLAIGLVILIICYSFGWLAITLDVLIKAFSTLTPIIIALISKVFFNRKPPS